MWHPAEYPLHYSCLTSIAAISRDELLGLQSDFERHLQEALEEIRVRSDYGGLVEPLFLDLSEFVSRKAKRIRPLLFLAACRLFEDGDPAARPRLQAALALELLHSFILVHDDIIDSSETRRGLPTFHKVVASRLGETSQSDLLGRNLALVAGDLLFALAVEQIATADFPGARRTAALNLFLRSVHETGCGEIEEILLGRRDIALVGADAIRRMYTLKTTRYTIDLPLVLAATLAGMPDAAITSLRAFANPVGLAFQIANDLQEFGRLDPSVSATHNDIAAGRKTLLVRAAFDRLSETDASFFQLCLSAAASGRPPVFKIAELIRRSGAPEALREEITRLFQEAVGALDPAEFTAAQREGLLGLVAFIRQQTTP